nr:hypothetical protein CoNPh38_CDS0403 [Staphylococcus phage S-CoN_Ph38]
MSFQDLLNKEINANDNQRQESYQPPHERLVIGKGKQDGVDVGNGYKVLVRILPTIQPNGHFGQVYRKAIISYYDSQNDRVRYQDIKAPVDQETYATQKLDQWLHEERHLGKYKPNLRLMFVMNVVQLVRKQDGTFEYLIDQKTGTIKVQAFEITQSAYLTLMQALKDPDNVPTGCQSEYSFISEEAGAPVEFVKPKQGSGKMNWDVIPKVNLAGNLPPLPQGWQNECSDLVKLAEPTPDSIIKNFVEPNVEQTQGVNQEPTQQQIDQQVPWAQSQQPQQQAPTQQQNFNNQYQPQQNQQPQQQQTGHQNTQYQQQAPQVDWDRKAQEQLNQQPQQPQQQQYQQSYGNQQSQPQEQQGQNEFSNYNLTQDYNQTVGNQQPQQNGSQQQAQSNVPPQQNFNQQSQQSQQSQQQQPQQQSTQDVPEPPQGQQLPNDVDNLLNEVLGGNQ